MRRILYSLTLLAIPLLMSATEEPAHGIVQTLGDVEIREYEPYVVAEVLVDCSAEEAGNRAFPILAGYIFGKNKGQRKFAMTAPVTQTAAPTRMKMTTPVTQAETPEGFVVQFVLPKGVTLESAPEPLDERVKLRAVPATRIAAIRYSGTWSEGNYSRHVAKLQAALDSAGLRWIGDPVNARYNPPWTPWFMRRNEVWLQLPPLPKADQAAKP